MRAFHWIAFSFVPLAALVAGVTRAGYLTRETSVRAASPPPPPAPMAPPRPGSAALLPQSVRSSDLAFDLHPMMERVRCALQPTANGAAIRDVLLHGSMQFGSHPGRFNLLFNAAGCYLQEIEGPITVATGFDGKSTWALATSVSEGGYGGVNFALPDALIPIITGRWATSESLYRLEPEGIDPLRGLIALRLIPSGDGPITHLQIDEKTSLPRSVHWSEAANSDRWWLSEYRRSLGLMLPHRISHTRGQETDQYVVTSISEAPKFAQNPYHAAALRLARTRTEPRGGAQLPPLRG
jgi:hypothetical protein